MGEQIIQGIEIGAVLLVVIFVVGGLIAMFRD